MELKHHTLSPISTSGSPSSNRSTPEEQSSTAYSTKILSTNPSKRPPHLTSPPKSKALAPIKAGNPALLRPTPVLSTSSSATPSCLLPLRRRRSSSTMLELLCDERTHH
uniref:Uncharacterized protein n=1 Tax=Arundo donax TaxID=35708 RepID=A0A0A8Z7E6_ARUDO